MQTIEFHSHEQQDEFIYNLFGQKQNGFFLDISCGNPIIGSNSYTLEKFCSWSGIGFDLLDIEELYQWSQKRSSKFLRADATSEQLTELIKTNVPTDQIVDYISLDVDAANNNLAFKALERIVASGVKFKAMTFEHENYMHGDSIRGPARALLESLGYIRLFEDVRYWDAGATDERNMHFEDWWIHPDYFDTKIIKAARSGLYYYQCIEVLKELMGNEYIAQHNCSRGWPEEYKLFWHNQEEDELKNLFPLIPPRQQLVRVYDCFTFYNEFDLLELRLKEHWNHVDYFVISEANKTHQGHAKPFLLADNWERYSEFHSKIIHIKVDNMPTDPNAWVLENFQRNALARGLTNASPNDVMVVSDLDEIIRSDALDFMREDTEHTIWTTRCPMFYYKLNYMMIAPQNFFTNAVAAKVGKGFSPQDMRNLAIKYSQLPHNYIDDEVITLGHGGWHFTYFGNTEHAANKLRNFAHQESNHWADKIDVNEIIARKGGIDPNSAERFEYVVIDDYFPKTVINDLERWKDYILPNATAKVEEFLP
jgi:hypothetical protein